MIVGRCPRMPVIGDTVLSLFDDKRGAGIIVAADAVRYKVYWRDGRDTVRWHVRRELTVPRLDYTVMAMMQPSASNARANNVLESWRQENDVPDRRQGSRGCACRHSHGRGHRADPGQDQ